VNHNKNQIIKLIIFCVSAIGVFGSLYFSEIMKLPPCSLCWYQRIFLYPVAIISLIQIIKNQFDDYTYEFVMAGVGFIIALYHNLIYYGVIENIVPCMKDVSCTSRQIEWFGVVTIPLISLLAFAFILSLALIAHFSKEKISYDHK
jgi:disulfide bond formation protein DsbB